MSVKGEQKDKGVASLSLSMSGSSMSEQKQEK